MGEKWMTSGSRRVQVRRDSKANNVRQRAAVVHNQRYMESPARPAYQKNHPFRPRKVTEVANPNNGYFDVLAMRGVFPTRPHGGGQQLSKIPPVHSEAGGGNSANNTAAPAAAYHRVGNRLVRSQPTSRSPKQEQQSGQPLISVRPSLPSTTNFSENIDGGIFRDRPLPETSLPPPPSRGLSEYYEPTPPGKVPLQRRQSQQYHLPAHYERAVEHSFEAKWGSGGTARRQFPARRRTFEAAFGMADPSPSSSHHNHIRPCHGLDVSRLGKNATGNLAQKQPQSVFSSHRLHTNSDMPMFGLDLKQLGRNGNSPSQVTRSPSVPKTVRTINEALATSYNDDLSDIRSVSEDNRPTAFRLPDFDDKDSSYLGQQQQHPSSGFLTYGSPTFAASRRVPGPFGNVHANPIVQGIARFQNPSHHNTTPQTPLQTLTAGANDNTWYRSTDAPPNFTLARQGLARFQTHASAVDTTTTDGPDQKGPSLPGWLTTPQDDCHPLLDATHGISHDGPQFISTLDNPNRREMQQIRQVGSAVEDTIRTDVGVLSLPVDEKIDGCTHTKEGEIRPSRSQPGGIAKFRFGGPTEAAIHPSKHNNAGPTTASHETTDSGQAQVPQPQDPTPPLPPPINQVSPHQTVQNPYHKSKSPPPPLQYTLFRGDDTGRSALGMQGTADGSKNVPTLFTPEESTPTNAPDEKVGSDDEEDDVCSRDLPDTYRSDDSMSHPLPPVMRHPDFSTNRSGIRFFIGDVQVDMRGKALNPAEQGQVDALLTSPPETLGKKSTIGTSDLASKASSGSVKIASSTSSDADCSESNGGVVSKPSKMALPKTIRVDETACPKGTNSEASSPVSSTTEISRRVPQSRSKQCAESAQEGVACVTNPRQPTASSCRILEESSSSSDDDSFSSIQHLLKNRKNLWD